MNEALFWSKVRKTESCWIWTGNAYRAKAKHRTMGYGRVHFSKEGYKLAHRAVYELLVGPIPGGLTLDHLCRNPICVNPKHLDLVTMRENILRGRGAAARNSRKTHCERGHPLIRGKWDRRCATCHREKDRLRKREYRRLAEIAKGAA